MVAYTKHRIPSCCGQTTLSYQLAFPIMKIHLDRFVGYSVNQAFKQAGMFYIENAHMSVQAQFGTTRLHIKCKQKNCESMTANLDQILDDIYADSKK